ncbi:hypothetical protein B0H13DRAFT_1857058 [Mycena leptocephala]|nr:hypothetical protein B0H13DRAFT_1857058 [Mycena leptocephala]
MAAVGIWLWSDPSNFGQPLATSCDPTLIVVGVPARFSSKPLRIASLTMYSIVFIPGLNLIPPFVFFLTLHISYNWCQGRHQSPSSDIERQPPHSSTAVSGTVTQPGTAPNAEQGGPSQCSSTAVSSGVAQPKTSYSSPNNALPIVNPAVSGAVQPGTPHTAFLIVGLVSLVAINVLFIVDIELTLRRNKGDQNGDDQWGFGQVLALLLLIIPLRDAWGALQEIREKLKGFQRQFGELLLRECQATPVVDEIQQLYGKIELLQSLRQEGIKDTPGTIPTSNHIYNPDYFKADNFKQRSNLQQQGGMFPW